MTTTTLAFYIMSNTGTRNSKVTDESLELTVPKVGAALKKGGSIETEVLVM